MAHNQLFESWIAGYVSAWRSVGTKALRELFTDDATYSAAPFEEPLTGLAAIAEFWEAERTGPGESFGFASEIVAVDNLTAVARVHVIYNDERAATYKDLWIIVLDAAGLCTHFEEWPSYEGQPRTIPR